MIFITPASLNFLKLYGIYNINKATQKNINIKFKVKSNPELIFQIAFKSVWKAVFVCLLLIIFVSYSGLSGEYQEKLTPEQARWLEDVKPIITRVEREVFLKLKTASDREKFIRFFWKTRDPKPDTSVNEFLMEYMARVRFADQNFSHGSSKRGSQSDRGLFYLLLGPPLERQMFTTQSDLWPLELWFYKGDTDFGLPPYFYLIFFQPEGIGDYRLYSPGVDGPDKLVVPRTSGRGLEKSNAIDIIKRVNAELASAARSYRPQETPFGTASLESDLIIASIMRLPEKKFSDAYARTYLSLKDYIETEYADNYLNSVFQIKIFKHSSQPFIHWSIEPEKMNFTSDGKTIYASFELILKIEDLNGQSIFERTEEIPLRLTLEQYKAHERQRFAFQDVLPVIPGDYKLFFLLKNKTAREFSSFETRISVNPEEQPGLSKPLLFLSREKNKDGGKNFKAFVIGDVHYLVGARNEFWPESTLGVVFQVWNFERIGSLDQAEYTVEILSLDKGKTVGTFPLSEVASDNSDTRTVTVSGLIPLSRIEPGYYRAEISLNSRSSEKLLSESENFIILPAGIPVIPWVYSRMRPPFPDAEHLKILGLEYFLAQNYKNARKMLEQIPGIKEDPASQLLLAKSFFGLGSYNESLALAIESFQKTSDREAAKVIALCYAGLKNWPQAIVYLEKLMEQATEIPVLNLAAECYLENGQPDKALAVIRKSLVLLPGQPSLRQLEEKAKKMINQK